MSQIPSSASIRARRARDRYDRCPVCRGGNVDGLHVDRCTEEKAYRDAALDLGRTAGVPEATTADLWAHARSRTHSVLYATEVVRLAIDLGWRPVVGSDPRRLWVSTPTACDTCEDTGLVSWMVEGDPNCYQEPDADGKIPCLDCQVASSPGSACACGSPEAYSLKPSEVIVHAPDGCTVERATTPPAQTGSAQ